MNAGIPKAEELMKAAGKKYELVIYKGATHGFMREGEIAYAALQKTKRRARTPGRAGKHCSSSCETGRDSALGCPEAAARRPTSLHLPIHQQARLRHRLFAALRDGGGID